jgi:LuxR family maltose regulon positive regulatory protein
MRALAAAGDVADELGGTVVLGSMWTARGRPDQARLLFERALETAEEHPGAALASLGDLHVGLAEVLVEQGRLDQAAEHLGAASSLGESASLMENRHRWAAVAGRLRVARGDLDGAAELMRQAAEQYLPGFFPDVRPIPAQRARLDLARGRLADARGWASDVGVATRQASGYLDEFNQLTLVRLLLAEHRAGSSADSLDEADRRLTDVARDAEQGGRGASLLDVHLLRALVHDARGDRDGAVEELAIALAQGVPAGFVRLFLDEGDPLERLLPAAERHATAGIHARTLRHATHQPAPTAHADAGSDPLSEREVEVLRLLATTLSGPDIARELYVSVNTLRTHTKHIFTRLDVNTRRAAVDRARKLGLL